MQDALAQRFCSRPRPQSLAFTVLCLWFQMEPAFISSYLSPMETPFRHLLWGRGAHTLASMAETSDMEQLRIQLALATSTLHGCASAMAEDIWAVTEQN